MTPAIKMARMLPILDCFKQGYLSKASFTQQFWKPGGVLYRRERSSDRYLITRHPKRPATIVRLTPSSNRSTRIELFAPTINRQIFKRACTDHQLAGWHWSESTSNDLILSMTDGDAFDIGAVVAELFNRGKFS